MKKDNVFNIVRGNVLPYSLTSCIVERQESVISFNDSLLFGDLFSKQFYNASDRFQYWKKLYNPLGLKCRFSDFKHEKMKYEKIKRELENGNKIVIWYSNDPNDILLLWSLSVLFFLHSNYRNTFLANYLQDEYLQYIDFVPITDVVCRNMKELWELYVTDKSQFIKIGDQFDKHHLLCSSLKILVAATDYIQPTINFQKTLIAPLDGDILKVISENEPISKTDIFNKLYSKLHFFGIGDIYLFYKLFYLENVLHMIKAVKYSTSQSVCFEIV
jgi:hypothetical protein